MTQTPATIVNQILSPRTSMSPGSSDSLWVRSLYPEEADGPYLKTAIRIVSEVGEGLGIDPRSMYVTLFKRCAPDDDDAVQRFAHVNGFVPTTGDQAGESIFLSAELSIARLHEVAAHETRHAWQFRQGWNAFRPRPANEHDAREFGRAWAQWRLGEAWRRQRPGEPVPKAFV